MTFGPTISGDNTNTTDAETRVSSQSGSCSAGCRIARSNPVYVVKVCAAALVDLWETQVEAGC